MLAMYSCTVLHNVKDTSCDVARITTTPVTVADQTDCDYHSPVGGKLSAIIDQARVMAVNAEVMKSTINEKTNTTLCVNAVSIVEMNIDKHCE